MEEVVHKVASGEILLWVEKSGAICLKVDNKFNDPADLSAEEAIELAKLLLDLANKDKDNPPKP
jgi:hypothetical protein